MMDTAQQPLSSSSSSAMYGHQNGTSSPHHQYHGYDFGYGSSGSEIPMNHRSPNPHLDLDDPHNEPLPQIYEQSESDGGFTDLNLLSDDHMNAMNALQFDNLVLHSPTQPSALWELPGPVPLPTNGHLVGLGGAISTPSSPSPAPPNTAFVIPSQPHHHTTTPPNQFPPNNNRVGGHVRSASSSSQQAQQAQQQAQPHRLDVSNLEQFLSAHSPAFGTSPELTPNSDWESSSQLSFDGSLPLNHPSPNGGGGERELEHGSSAGLRRSSSASATYADGGKSYRRNIEKKSRDKKTIAYMRLKQELETISLKNYGQRCQAEVFEGACQLLVDKQHENQRLALENQVLKDKLKQYGHWVSDS